jgi:hypothetical protein
MILRSLIEAGKGSFATPGEADAFIRQERDAWKQEEPTMPNAIRQTVRVKPGGLIEIRSPELTPGTLAEVIVLLEPSEVASARAARVRELAALFKATQSLPQAQAISEDEIAAEIAAYRAV